MRPATIVTAAVTLGVAIVVMLIVLGVHPLIAGILGSAATTAYLYRR